MKPYSSKKREDMQTVGFIEGILIPRKKERYREYKAYLMQDAREKTKQLQEKTKNGVDPQEFNSAFRAACLAIAKARKYIGG